MVDVGPETGYSTRERQSQDIKLHDGMLFLSTEAAWISMVPLELVAFT